MINVNHIRRSQIGGESAKTGFNYERSFIAFLCARIICEKESISEIVCEYRNDIEIRRAGVLESYQIKSTRKNTLRFQEVVSSLELFSVLNDVDTYSQFVLVSNRNLTKYNMETLVAYEIGSIPGLTSKILKAANNRLNSELLSKIRVMRGPELENARAVIRDELSCVKDRDTASDELLSFISKVWTGLSDLASLRIEEIRERKKRQLEAKTITLKRLRKEVLKEFDEVRTTYDLSSIVHKIDEELNSPNEVEIRVLIKKFSEDTSFQESVLKRFDSLSKETRLYESQSFLRFLKRISGSNDPLVLSYFLYILHNLILNSQKTKHSSYVKLIANYKKLLLSLFTNYDQKGKRCYNHVKNILQTIGLNEQEWCKIHWDRVLNAIRNGITSKEIEGIYDDIASVRRCSQVGKYFRQLDKLHEYPIAKVIQPILISD